tara:strand:+ start:1588 stop:1812 length:225 start_codon:yes stop_codon:yes gene_type:complete
VKACFFDSSDVFSFISSTMAMGKNIGAITKDIGANVSQGFKLFEHEVQFNIMRSNKKYLNILTLFGSVICFFPL